jgi:hypothetical protein
VEAKVEALAELEAAASMLLLILEVLLIVVAAVVLAVTKLPESVLLDEAPREEEEFLCLELTKRYRDCWCCCLSGVFRRGYL